MNVGKSPVEINWSKICPARYQTLVDDLHRDKKEPLLDRFQGSEKDHCQRHSQATTVAFPLYYSRPSPSTFRSFLIEVEQVVSTESDASHLSASLIVLPYVNSPRRSSASRLVVLFQFWLSSSQTNCPIARTSRLRSAREGKHSYKSLGR